MNVTVNDIDELQVFSRRETFFKIFFEIHGCGYSSAKSVRESYFKAEVIFVKKFHGRAYKTDECFNRTFYYHLNTMLGKTSGTPEGHPPGRGAS